MLEGFVFILHRAFQPVLRIEIQNNTALIKTMVAVRKVRFHDKRKELFLCLHLKYRRIVIAKVVVNVNENLSQVLTNI